LNLTTKKHQKLLQTFLEYVRDGFYDGVIFHRVIDGFMIGAVDENFKEKATRDAIENEADNVNL
jgi:peptidyl-prolyl cis-trans isomerase B (cyclophilin B)